jgi:O-antigen/teichoic acid export membrane protein
MNKLKIFKFWIPLAATWLMMSFEGPFLAAIIARLADPKYNLAAWGVAFSFALIVEAPIIMIMSASTALVEDSASLFKLRRFTNFLNAAITFLMIILLIPEIFEFITLRLIGLPHKVSDLTHIATLLLLPWPSAIGYRRFYQGILIRHNLTKRVAYGTVLRMISISTSAILLYIYIDLPGVAIAAISLSTGVLIEAVASRVMVHKTINELINKTETNKDLTYRKITNFYYPLALTSMLALGVHPLVTFFVGNSLMALESLAVLPVINSLVFIFRSLGLSYQEVGIALVGKNWEGYKDVKEFAYLLSGGVISILGIIAFTPLADIWFGTISGLSPELSEFAILPLQIMVLMPGLSVLLSFQRSLLVAGRKTGPITFATASEVLGIVIVMYITIIYFNLIGAVGATLAFIIGRLAANIYLIKPNLNLYQIKSAKIKGRPKN